MPVTHVSAPYFDWLTSNAFPPLVPRQITSERPAPPAES
jgi:hypothetical protein